MNFNFVSKHNIGLVATLIFFILLSQIKIFDFLIDTAFGRALLILFILGISYTNQILGVVSVLFIIIMFNQSNISYIEGFTSNYSNKTETTHTNNNVNLKEKQNLKIHDLKSQQDTTTTSSAIATLPTSTPINNSFVGGREGFNIIDREGTILRGKRSNELPVFFNARSQSDDVEPTNKSVFTDAYSIL